MFAWLSVGGKETPARASHTLAQSLALWLVATDCFPERLLSKALREAGLSLQATISHQLHQSLRQRTGSSSV